MTNPHQGLIDAIDQAAQPNSITMIDAATIQRLVDLCTRAAEALKQWPEPVGKAEPTLDDVWPRDNSPEELREMAESSSGRDVPKPTPVQAFCPHCSELIELTVSVKP